VVNDGLNKIPTATVLLQQRLEFYANTKSRVHKCM
jgi:hypothetical protein